MKRISVTITDEQEKNITNIAKARECSKADVIREIIDRGLSAELNEENIKFVSEILEKKMEQILEPHIERLVSISEKGAIMSSTSTFLNAQALADFVAPDKRRDLKVTYDKARLKGVAYVKGRVSDTEKEVQEAIKQEVKNKLR